MATDADYDNAIEVLKTGAELQGVGVVTVKDGTIFMFTAARLQQLLQRAQASPQKQALVFVRQPRPQELS